MSFSEIVTDTRGKNRRPEQPSVYELDPPDVSTGRLRAHWRVFRWRRKARKLASKGYVQWYLLNGQWTTPKFVKPAPEGGGIPELEHDGKTYLFPRDAMLPASDTGMWTVVHKEGEADPVNLRDPTALSIPADVLDEYLEMSVTSSPPGFFERFDIDTSDLIKYLIFGIIAYALFVELAGNLGGLWPL